MIDLRKKDKNPKKTNSKTPKVRKVKPFTLIMDSSGALYQKSKR
jgi:hypothetical protein